MLIQHVSALRRVVEGIALRTHLDVEICSGGLWRNPWQPSPDDVVAAEAQQTAADLQAITLAEDASLGLMRGLFNLQSEANNVGTYSTLKMKMN